MQVRFANRDEFAWDQGEQAYQPGDTLAVGKDKAQQVGLRPGCNGYSAFITAFSRRIRQYQESGNKSAGGAPLAVGVQLGGGSNAAEGLQPAG